MRREAKMNRRTFNGELPGEVLLSIYASMLKRNIDLSEINSLQVNEELLSAEDAALLTAVSAYTADSERMSEQQPEALKRALKYGFRLEERFDSDESEYTGRIDFLCYWAFAELFRLTKYNRWLELCIYYEGRVESFEQVLSTDLIEIYAAACWALYRAGKADFYRERLKELLKASSEKDELLESLAGCLEKEYGGYNEIRTF